MTKLAFAESRLEISKKHVWDTALLRASLAPRWAILFSHPDDFAQEHLEMDRWVTVVARSFNARGVVPVALARPQSNPEQGWLGQLAALDGNSAAVLTLDDPSAALADFSGGALRTQIDRSGPRFAMILDSSLRCRRTLSYRLPAELPSPLELIGWAVALRQRDHGGESPSEAPRCSLPIRPAAMRGARYSFAQAGRG
jgi:hypothetical protein